MERIQDKLKQGLISTDEANIEMVKCQRVRLITSKLPSNIRKVLNKAVKDGILGHMKKDDYKPECYYFKPFEYLAHKERANEHNKSIDALNNLSKIFVNENSLN